nr:MAG TPA: DNA directed DNA polymerase [Caudoviricetes sp.]
MLKFDLAQHGVGRFHIFRNNGENIQTNCPFHKNGQERKPSFGVNGEIDKCHCFACGWSGTIEEMISELYGYQDEGKFGKRWLIKRFNTVEIETRPNIMEGFNGRNNITIRNNNDIHRFKQHIQGNKSTEQYSGEITEEELDKYRYIHPYMYERKMDDRVIEIFDVGYDKETECITFPIRDKNGNCLFIARRSVNTKFFSYPQGVEKPLYGLYELYQLDEFPKEIYICESMIDAITIWTHCDKYAVALNGLGNDLQFSQLNNMPNRTFILATDNDSAGIKARIRLKKYITNKIIKEIILPSNRKDINECTYNEFENIKITF